MTYTFVFAPDSFKESLSAKAVCQAMESGIRCVFPDANVIHVPMADGSEGSTESVADATGGEILDCPVSDPLGRPVMGKLASTGASNLPLSKWLAQTASTWLNLTNVTR